MPFKSKAQRRKFAELLVKGEITPETYEEWNRETGRVKLPERVKRSGSTRKKSSAPPAPRGESASAHHGHEDKARLSQTLSPGGRARPRPQPSWHSAQRA